MDARSLFWLMTALVGLALTGHNLRRAYRRWRILDIHGAREALRITAFTPVRTHSLILYIHITFLLLGINSVFPDLVPIVARALGTNIITDAFLLVPLALIIASFTINRDDDKTIALERHA